MQRPSITRRSITEWEGTPYGDRDDNQTGNWQTGNWQTGNCKTANEKVDNKQAGKSDARQRIEYSSRRCEERPVADQGKGRPGCGREVYGPSRTVAAFLPPNGDVRRGWLY